MRRNPQALFGLAILVVGIWALLATRDWPIKTALYPRVIGVPLVVLAAIEVTLNLRGHAEEKRQAVDLTLSETLPANVTARRTAVAFAWILGFFLTIVLLGFPVAIPVFVLAYLRLQGRESWMLSIVLAAAAWLAFYVVFDRLLHLPFAEGLLLQLFTR